MSDTPPPQYTKEQKPQYRHWYQKKRWVLPLIFIVLIVMIGIASGGDSEAEKSDKKKTNTTTAAPGASAESATTTTTSDRVEVTLDEHNRVQTGMNYQQVKDIFGGQEQSADSSSYDAGSLGKFSTDTLTWDGDGFGDTVIIQFDGGKDKGKVSSKSQYGLGNG